MIVSSLVVLLSPIIAVGGWYFVYKNSNRIATRAEAYALVAKAVDKILEVDKRCAEYWFTTTAKREASWSWISGTQAQLHAVRTLLEILEKHHGFTDKDVTLMKLRRAATLNAEKVQGMAFDDLSKKRRAQADALNHSLHTLYGYYRVSYD